MRQDINVLCSRMSCLDGCVACAQEIDLAKPASNRNKTAGFFDAEREGFKKV
jgi:hypothetical protein